MVAAPDRTDTDRSHGIVCTDTEKRYLVDHDDARMHKHNECLARPAGTTILHAQNHDGAREAPSGTEGTVVADDYRADLRSNDYGRGCTADILQTAVADILVGTGILHPGRCLSADDTDEHAIVEKSRQHTGKRATPMAMATEKMEGTDGNAGADAVATGTDVLQPDGVPSGTPTAGRTGMHAAGSGICTWHNRCDSISDRCCHRKEHSEQMGRGVHEMAADNMSGTVACSVPDHDTKQTRRGVDAIGIHICSTNDVWHRTECLPKIY